MSLETGPSERLVGRTRPETVLEEPVEAIVRRAQGGDREAFAALVQRFERPALAVAFAVLADGNAAGDTTQEAFVRAWQRLAGLRQPNRFGPWLCGIVRNLARDARRSTRRERRRRVDLPCLAVQGSVSPTSELERKEADQRMAAALDSLDEISRMVVVLRYYDNLGAGKLASYWTSRPRRSTCGCRGRGGRCATGLATLRLR